MYLIDYRAELAQIAPAALDPSWDTVVDPELYAFVEAYAQAQQLRSTALSLALMRWTMAQGAENPDSRFRNPAAHIGYFRHALAVCRMLIDLHIPLNQDEEDILLAAAICHVLPESIRTPDLSAVLTDSFRLNPEVAKVVDCIFWEDNENSTQQRSYYERIQQNRLALLIKLADRGNLVEQLSGVSGWRARRYIQETRTYFFPMCIYAKEWYPELIAPVSVMMEKIRCIIEAAEILLSRYEARENALVQEILELQEENATIRGIIHAVKKNSGNKN